MKAVIKNHLKDEISKMFLLLSKGEYYRHQSLITSNPDIMQAFYIYEYTFSNHRTVPYLRRLCRGVIDTPSFKCEHIASMRLPVQVGKRWKKYWVWGYPDDSQGKVVLMQYDAISGGIVKAAIDKSEKLGQPIQLTQTEKAIAEAEEEVVAAEEEKAEAQEEAAIEAKARTR